MRFRPLPVLLALSSLLVHGQAAVQPFTLPTGLKCLLVENHERPLVRMELSLRVEPADEPWARNGHVGFLAALMGSAGAGPYTRAAFNRAADDLGLVYGFEGRRDAFHWSLVTDSRSQEPAFALLANAVFRSDFDSPQLEALRRSLLLRAAGASLRERAVAGFLWNLQDPQATLVPGGAGLERMDLQELLTLQRRLIRPENAVLALHGDLSLAQAKELATLHFGVWGPPAVPVPVLKTTVPVPAEVPFMALLEGSSRAELWVGAARSTAPLGPEEPVLAVLLERLCRASGEGLNLELSLRPGGPWILKAGVRDVAKDALVPGVMSLLDALRTKGFTAEELDRAKVLWRSRHLALPLHPEALLHGILAQTAGPAMEQAVAAVTLAEVNKALTAWLEPARLRFLLLGGDADLLKAAEQAGLGRPALVRAQ